MPKRGSLTYKYSPGRGPRVKEAGGVFKVDPGEEYLSVAQLASRIPYRPKSIRNMLCQGVFVEGEHYTRLTGRPIFFWSRVQQLLREGSHGRQGTNRPEN
jgi:hypothetical protein